MLILRQVDIRWGFQLEWMAGKMLINDAMATSFGGFCTFKSMPRVG
jgi:hypothetical protein